MVGLIEIRVHVVCVGWLLGFICGTRLKRWMKYFRRRMLPCLIDFGE